MAATIKAPVIFTAKDRVTPTMSKMSRSVKGFSRRASVGIARVEHRFNRLMSPIDRVGKMLGQFGIIAGGFLAYQVFDDITTFETGMGGVSKTTGIVKDDLKELGGDIINLSNEMRGVSTESLVEVAEAAGQLGVKGRDNILKFSKVMAQLESATDVSGQRGAKMIARLLTVTKEGVGVIDRFGASITELGNNSAATEREILGVASEVARGTSAYGLQAKEVLGLSAAFQSLDVSPRAAGTAISKTLRKIESAVLSGGDELKKFAKLTGKTTDQFVEQFEKSPQKAFESFIGGLNKVQKQGGSVVPIMESLGLYSETVLKGIVPLSGSFEMLQDKLQMSSRGWKENTALQKEFDASTQSVNVAIADIRKSFTNLMLQTSNTGDGMTTLKEVLFAVADNMKTIVIVGATFIGLWLAIKGAIIIAKVALGAYNIALGINTAITQNNKRALIGNALAQGTYRVAMALSSAATWIGTTAMSAFAIATNSAVWPILLVVAAIVAIIAIIMNWDAIVAWFSKKWEQFTALISSAWKTTVDFFKEFDFMNFFKSIGNAVIEYMLFPLKSVLKLLSNIPGKVGTLASQGLELVNKVKFEQDKKENETVLPSTTQASNQQTNETIRDSRVNIDVRDKGNNVERVEQDGNEIPIMMQYTTGF